MAEKDVVQMLRETAENTYALLMQMAAHIEKIELEKHHLGLWKVNILSNNNNVVSTIAMRDEEMERVFIESERCGLSIL